MERDQVIKHLKETPLEILQGEADKIRKLYCGDKIYIRGIIEFSNYCCRSCLYCGLRKENKKLTRYRMTQQEIIQLANKIISYGVKTIVLQSGDDFGYSAEWLAGIIQQIKRENPGIAITLCVGERPFPDYQLWKQAGADRFLLKHETANPKLYEKLDPGQSFKHRIEILKYLRKLGYQIGAGNIVGLPGQTKEDLADDILLLKELDVDMAGIGPFIPQKDTLLAGHKPPKLSLVLKVLALARMVTKNAHLPATTALATLDPEKGQVLGLKSGCNVLMPDFTPEEYRKNYLIYDNKKKITLAETKKTIISARRKVCFGRGDPLKILCRKHQKDLDYTLRFLADGMSASLLYLMS